MKVCSQDLVNMGIADRLIKEPLGGVHHDPLFVYDNMKSMIIEEIESLFTLSKDDLIQNRLEKFNSMGVLNK